MSVDDAVRQSLVRRGVALEIFTLLWMTVEAAVAVAAGVAAGSVALLAFGIDSVIEFIAAFVVLQTFRAEQTGRAVHGEHRALRVIGLTFLLLAAYVVCRRRLHTRYGQQAGEQRSRCGRLCRGSHDHAVALNLEATHRDRLGKPDACG